MTTFECTYTNWEIYFSFQVTIISNQQIALIRINTVLINPSSCIKRKGSLYSTTYQHSKYLN